MSDLQGGCVGVRKRSTETHCEKLLHRGHIRRGLLATFLIEILNLGLVGSECALEAGDILDKDGDKTRRSIGQR